MEREAAVKGFGVALYWSRAHAEVLSVGLLRELMMDVMYEMVETVTEVYLTLEFQLGQ